MLLTSEIDSITFKSGPEVVVETELRDYEGNVYETVKIGNQTWMAENIRSTIYPDGTPISLVSSASSWNALPSDGEAYCYYNNDNSNKDDYGGMYTWTTAMKVCPTGWHLPSLIDLNEVINYLGGSTVAGGKMKEVGLTHWNSPNTAATNSSGFTGLPGGYREDAGNYSSMGAAGFFWTSSTSTSDKAYFRFLSGANGETATSTHVKTYGFNVRCVKD